jgi:HTH-type transcriptional regulator, glycine betaine synthesis regulator
MDAVVVKLVEELGNATQSLGFGRALGQIYAFAYLSPTPCTLDDLKDGLGISKGSASMGVRQLEQWGALRRIWIKGDRKDYYEANDWFGRILQNIVSGILSECFNHRDSFLAEMESDVRDVDDPERRAMYAQRIEKMRRFSSKARKALNNPVVRRLLG